MGASNVIGVDLDGDALDVARRNMSQYEDGLPVRACTDNRPAFALPLSPLATGPTLLPQRCLSPRAAQRIWQN